MSRDWKPGDVAMVDSWRGRGQLAFRTERGDAIGWCVLDGSDSRGLDDLEVGNARPVVVIDPEDYSTFRPALESWTRLVFGYTANERDCELFADALREFANPTPTIEEPTGLGAVVEDANGRLWVRAEKAKGMQNPWQDTLSDDPASDQIRAVAYADIDVVRVLSEGIS